MAMDIEEKRRRDRERQTKRYAEDPKFRERRKAASREYEASHRVQINERNRRRYAGDPKLAAKKIKVRWERRLKSRYGLTGDDYNEMLAHQEHVCLLCRRRGRRQLAVDHCHQTNLVRAL